MAKGVSRLRSTAESLKKEPDTPPSEGTGARMSADHMRSDTPGAKAIGPARLDGYRLAFNVTNRSWGGGAANAVCLALLVSTGVTTSIAFIDLGPLNTIVALVIATCKALLVVLIFMHVKYASDKLVKVVVISAVFFLMLLLGLSLADYSTRML